MIRLHAAARWVSASVLSVAGASVYWASFPSPNGQQELFGFAVMASVFYLAFRTPTTPPDGGGR